MPFHVHRPVLMALSLFALSLSGCQTTGPSVAKDVGPHDIACQVAAPSNGAMARVRLSKGDASALEDESTASACATLSRVGQALQDQGSAMGFEVIGPMRTHAQWNQVDNLSMRQAVLAQPEPDSVHIIITERITQCGASVGYILGCTPASGRPFVFVKRHQLLQDWAPEWVIWAHELGHAVGLTHPDGANIEPTLPQRVMTYAPTPQSVELDGHEPLAFAQMQRFRVGGPVALTRAQAHEAAGAAVAPERVLQFVSRAGAHGVNLQALSHLSDAQLLPLRRMLAPEATLDALLRDAPLSADDVPALNQWMLASNDEASWPALLAQAGPDAPSPSVGGVSLGLNLRQKLGDWLGLGRAPRPQDLVAVLQSNAIAVMGDLGGAQTLDAVMQALSRQEAVLSLDARHLGLAALGRNLARTRAPALAAFLGAASVPQFWCPQQNPPEAECLALSQSARQALTQGRAMPTLKSL
jgi:hypothetical protein